MGLWGGLFLVESIQQSIRTMVSERVHLGEQHLYRGLGLSRSRSLFSVYAVGGVAQQLRDDVIHFCYLGQPCLRLGACRAWAHFQIGLSDWCP